jgi:Protein export membrane protein
MFHDVAILLGLFAWPGKPLDGVFLATPLTVIGYLVNDAYARTTPRNPKPRKPRAVQRAKGGDDDAPATVPRSSSAPRNKLGPSSSIREWEMTTRLYDPDDWRRPRPWRRRIH